MAMCLRLGLLGRFAVFDEGGSAVTVQTRCLARRFGNGQFYCAVCHRTWDADEDAPCQRVVEPLRYGPISVDKTAKEMLTPIGVGSVPPLNSGIKKPLPTC